jgi:hypothetical protein
MLSRHHAAAAVRPLAGAGPCCWSVPCTSPRVLLVRPWHQSQGAAGPSLAPVPGCAQAPFGQHGASQALPPRSYIPLSVHQPASITSYLQTSLLHGLPAALLCQAAPQTSSTSSQAPGPTQLAAWLHCSHSLPQLILPLLPPAAQCSYCSKPSAAQRPIRQPAGHPAAGFCEGKSPHPAACGRPSACDPAAQRRTSQPGSNPSPLVTA